MAGLSTNLWNYFTIIRNMKNIIEYFRSNIFNIFTAIFLYSILSIIFFLEYRLEVYMLLKKIYPELDKFSFFNYMGISFHFESKIILFFAIILPIIKAKITQRLMPYRHFLWGFSTFDALLRLLWVLSRQFCKTGGDWSHHPKHHYYCHRYTCNHENDSDKRIATKLIIQPPPSKKSCHDDKNC